MYSVASFTVCNNTFGITGMVIGIIDTISNKYYINTVNDYYVNRLYYMYYNVIISYLYYHDNDEEHVFSDVF